MCTSGKTKTKYMSNISQHVSIGFVYLRASRKITFNKSVNHEYKVTEFYEIQKQSEGQMHLKFIPNQILQLEANNYITKLFLFT